MVIYSGQTLLWVLDEIAVVSTPSSTEHMCVILKQHLSMPMDQVNVHGFKGYKLELKFVVYFLLDPSPRDIAGEE
jgi:hypothetical protein